MPSEQTEKSMMFGNFFSQINFYSKVQILRMLLYFFLNKILKNVKVITILPDIVFLKSAAR